MDDFLETHTPWWLNNLIRWLVSLPFIPLYALWEMIVGLLMFRAVFMRGSMMVEWPWEWDWWSDQ